MQAVTLGVGGPQARRALVGCREHRPPVDLAGPVAGEGARGVEEPALGGDDRPAVRRLRPQVGQRRGHEVARRAVGERVGHLAGGGVEDGVHRDAVDRRVGAGGDRGVCDAGRGRQVVHLRLREAGALALQPRQGRQRGGVPLEVVRAERVHHDEEHDARRRRGGAQRHGERAAGHGGGRRQPEHRGDGGSDVLVPGGDGESAPAHVPGPVQDQGHAGVVSPRRAVHEDVRGIVAGDEVAFAGHDHDLPAAAGVERAREVGQERVAGRRRARRAGSGAPARGRGARPRPAARPGFATPFASSAYRRIKRAPVRHGGGRLLRQRLLDGELRHLLHRPREVRVLQAACGRGRACSS